jgi:succinoglycan biosynthesis transport protein ExoP
MTDHDQDLMVASPHYHPAPSLPSPPPPLMDYDSEMYRARDLGEYIHLLLKRKWWIIGTFLTVCLATSLYVFTRTPLFHATATLQITQDNPGSQVSMDDKFSRVISMDDSLEKFQQTQYMILQSRSLAYRVIEALNLTEHPDFKTIKENSSGKTQADLENAMISAFLNKLKVTPVRNSYLVSVEFESPDKALAQKVVNAIADEYMYLSIDRRNESYGLVRKWLDKQLQEMAGKVQEAQKKLFKFGQKTDIFTLEDKDNVVIQKFIDLSSLLTKAQAERIAKEAQFQQIKDKGPNAPLIVNHPMVSGLRQQLVSQQAKVSGLQKVYRREHPDLQGEQALLNELGNRLKGEVQRLQESVKADYEAANRTEKLLSDSFSAQKQQVVKLQDSLTDFQILKRDAQTNEQLYQALLARVKEANIASTMVPSNVAVIDPARLPSRPFSPQKTRDLAVAMVVGLTLGIGLAILVEQLDDSIKSLDDLERVSNLPSLGILPQPRSNSSFALGERHRPGTLAGYLAWMHRGVQSDLAESDLDLIVCRNPKSMVSEALRHVYSSILLSASDRPPSAIMITSPTPSDGKTMLSSNLALSFALNGQQVVLIDCDLRKPRVHSIFQLDVQPGLSNFLTGNASLENILRASSIPNLTIISAGARPPMPGNLLNSQSFKDLLLHLRQQFRHIVIDTPPVLAFADARLLSSLVDGVLLVTKYHSTSKSACRMAIQLMRSAPVLGTVLNSVDRHVRCYGQYPYNNYYYNYYSKYYKDELS